MKDNEIKLSVIDVENSVASLTVSPLEDLRPSPRRILSVPDSTQREQAVVQTGSIRILPSESTTRKTGVNVHDVAAFILQQQGEMTAMKLQKVVYYSQAWSLVWDEEPLFNEEIEAWANGPVVRALYARHQRLFKVKEWTGDSQKLSDTQRETILKVLEFYGHMSSQVLSDLTHNEQPWLKARNGLGVGDRGSRVIPLADIAEYYSSL